MIIDEFSGVAEDIARVADSLAPFPRSTGTFYPGVRRMIGKADRQAYSYALSACEKAAHSRVRQCVRRSAAPALARYRITPCRSARRDNQLGKGTRCGRLQYPFRNPAGPAHLDAPSLGRRAWQWPPAQERAPFAQIPASLTGSRSRHSTKAEFSGSAAFARSGSQPAACKSRTH